MKTHWVSTSGMPFLIGGTDAGWWSVLLAVEDEQGDTLWSWRLYGRVIWEGVLAEDGTVVCTGVGGGGVLVIRLDVENREIVWERTFSIGSLSWGRGLCGCWDC